MSNFFTLWRRELAAYLLTPIAYGTAFILLAVTGLTFWRVLLENLGAPVTFATILFGPVFLWCMVLVLVAVTTMRLLAEEQRSGTLETLLTAPVTDTEVVLAKYAAALSFFVAVFAPTLAYVPVVKALSTGLSGVDVPALATGYLILLLVGAFYLAIGLLISALTRSQMLAAVATLTVCGVSLFADYFRHVVPGGGGPLLSYLSPVQHILEFSRGVVDTRPIVLYVSSTVFLLFATVRILESRTWR